MPQQTYAQILRETEQEKGPITSISIVTIPFDSYNIREKDSKFFEMSKRVAFYLRQYFENRLPDASVAIDISPKESSVSAATRLIQA
mmetsp:Transcript_26128/g.36834  ORF Transcript_26128/g.36834 Transcript_26128/m.36834 type:complete len:87 (-) Transcript_26128:348-608(-)